MARELQGLLAIHNSVLNLKPNFLRRAVISDESEELKRRREGAKLAREREILREKERWEKEREEINRSQTPPMRGARNTGGGEGAGVDDFPSTQESVASGLSGLSVTTSEEDPEAARWNQEFLRRERRQENDALRREGVPLNVPIDILQKILPVAVKEGLTERQAIMMTTAFIAASGGDLESFVISKTSCHRLQREEVERIGDSALTSYAEHAIDNEAKLGVHFDGKIMTQDFEGRKEKKTRMVTVLTSPDMDREQIMGVAPMDRETGYEVAYLVYGQLVAIGVDGNIFFAVSDTPSVNFGHISGAMVHLQSFLQRPILCIQCGHHVAELPAKAVMAAVSGRDPTSPADKLFSKLQNNWNQLILVLWRRSTNFGTWEGEADTQQGIVARKVLSWAQAVFEDNSFSGAYLDCIKLTLVFLGVKVNMTMPRPCAVSRARFLQMCKYYLIMYLLLDTAGMQQLLSRDECEEVKTMAVYVALHYLPAMCQAKYSAASPHNLITNIYNLRLVREESPVAAAVALAKWEQHLNWLSPELVVFAIFHPGMAAGEREEMARKLYSFRDGWQPGQRPIYPIQVPGPNFTNGQAWWPDGQRPSLSSFITERSYLLWEVNIRHFLLNSYFLVQDLSHFNNFSSSAKTTATSSG